MRPAAALVGVALPTTTPAARAAEALVDPDAGASPSGVAVSRDGRLIVTADRDDDQLTLIDAATLRATGTIAVGARPFGVTLDPENRRAYTANVGSDGVSVVDLKAGHEIARVEVGSRPYAVALIGGKAFVTDQYASTVGVFATGDLAPLATVPVGQYLEGIAVSPDGARVLVACWFDSTLVAIDSASLEVVGEVAFGAFIRP